ncbi:hypothetical protein BDV39DRAFT_211349 [Aspergillus sergii]|uniref:F-box domain-containing protein n=1 Tax=Aspergillus sergii TaxID=1034303 RepID=A0A5N6WKL8_9EURO|nr:hypothetical protein BDV39DRAFT_211349 [Aspergillus sergii]
MAVNSYPNTRNPLLIAEIVALVIENVDMAPDLLNCACVNSMWTVPALNELYRGSLNDMQFRTPGIESLNCLFVASRQRFSRNMSFVKHLLLAAEHVPDANWGAPFGRPMCFDVCRSMRHGDDAERLLLPQPWRLKSLMIPFEMANHYWDCIPDFICQTVELLAITNSDCTRFMWPHRHNLSTSNFPNLKALTVYISESEPVLTGLRQLLETHKFQLEFLHVEEWEDREPRDLARRDELLLRETSF